MKERQAVMLEKITQMADDLREIKSALQKHNKGTN